MESPGSAQVVVQAVWTSRRPTWKRSGSNPAAGLILTRVNSRWRSPPWQRSRPVLWSLERGEKDLRSGSGERRRPPAPPSPSWSRLPAPALPTRRRRSSAGGPPSAIRYSGKLRLDEEVRVTIQGDLAEDIKALAPEKPKSTGWSLFRCLKEPAAPPPPPDRQKCLADRAGDCGGPAKVIPQATANASPALRARGSRNRSGKRRPTTSPGRFSRAAPTPATRVVSTSTIRAWTRNQTSKRSDLVRPGSTVISQRCKT